LLHFALASDDALAGATEQDLGSDDARETLPELFQRGAVVVGHEHDAKIG
jgi:hypothetical protein